MKKIMFISLFVVLALNFTLKDLQFGMKDKYSPSSKSTILTACSSNQTNAFYSAISSCETASQLATINCVDSNIQLSLGQRWNFFAKRQSSFAANAHWVFSNCSISLSNYGKFNRSYEAWPAQSYSIGADSNCTIMRNSTVYNTIKVCQMYDEANSAQCILNALKTNINEYWDVYVASSRAASAVKYWIYDNCTVSFYNFGQYDRTYTTWKAY